MKTEINASGETLAVVTSLDEQITQACVKVKDLSATLKSLRDDLSRLAKQDGTVTIKATLDVTVDTKPLVVTERPAVVATDRVVIPNTLRSTTNEASDVK